MRVCFRADASLDIGTGHVMRCLTLAREIVLGGGAAQFICRAHDGNLVGHIRQQGFDVLVLPAGHQLASVQSDLAHGHWLGASQRQDADQCLSVMQGAAPDWLIVDHYSLDKEWELAVAGRAGKLMVIDDLADRRHSCSVLLDHNLGRSSGDYRALVPDACDILAGPRFALLRPEFAVWRDKSLERRRDVATAQSLLISLGGVDKADVTSAILVALADCDLPPACLITVVMGSTAPGLASVRAKCAALPWRTQVLTNVDNMAELMAQADVAIGAAGTTSWERCCVGLPTLVVVLADNQQEIAKSLVAAGSSHLLLTTALASGLRQFFASVDYSARLRQMSIKAAAIVDGRGCNRVVEFLRDSSSREN